MDRRGFGIAMMAMAGGGLLATAAVAQTAPVSAASDVRWTTEVRWTDNASAAGWTGSPGCGSVTGRLTWTTNVTSADASDGCQPADVPAQVESPAVEIPESFAAEWDSGAYFTPAPGQSFSSSRDDVGTSADDERISFDDAGNFTTDPQEVDGGFLDLSYGLDDIPDRQGVGGTADLMNGFSEMGDDSGVVTQFTPRIRGQLNFGYGQNPVDDRDEGEMLIAPGLAWGDRDRTEFRFMLPIEVTGERTDVGVMTGARRKF